LGNQLVGTKIAYRVDSETLDSRLKRSGMTEMGSKPTRDKNDGSGAIGVRCNWGQTYTFDI